MKSNLYNKYAWATFLLSFNVGSGSVYAAPGDLANSPLFLQSAVQPNIYFMVDDSGSMNFEITLNSGTSDPGGCTTSATACSNRDNGNVDFTPDNSTEDLLLCSGFNVMAYDPTQNYTPWVGKNNAGQSYTDRTLTTALYNPYSSTSNTNLSSHFYFEWADQAIDVAGHGVYASGECPTLNWDGNYLSSCRNTNGCVVVADLSSEEQANYANWYTYYRKRDYVAKRALSEIISKSKDRVGLGTINNNSQSGFSNQTIGDVDDITTPIDTVAQAKKTKLLSELFQIYANSGTPLRNALKGVGEYYKAGSSGLFSSSPILPKASGGECQQNFAVLLSDGFWNGGSPGVGNTDADGTGPYDGGVYADTQSNTLADVAMKYYEEDLDTSLDPKVKVSTSDPNPEQHMVTYTVAFGVQGSLTCNPADTSCSEKWPAVSADSSSTIDDMLHAATNGRGKFLSAGDPAALITSLNDTISSIAESAGTATAVSFNSTSVRAGSRAFQAEFNSSTWFGGLKAFNVSASGLGAEAWNASTLLDSRDISTNPRQIITYNGTRGVGFDWPSSFVDLGSYSPNLNADILSVAQISDLVTNSASRTPTTSVADYGSSMVSYLRGSFSNETPKGQKFRARNGHRLGDIVHSSPAYVDKPNARYPDDIEGSSNLYSAFKTAQASRAGRVYVGANDGMLHAFDTNGEEAFAYIPGLVYSSAAGEGLHALAEQSYIHRYYVDLSPSVADVFVGGAWKTYLLGGLRAGGKGIFALDITDPSALTESNAENVVKWEFTHNDLGYTFSDIQIGRMANGKWAAIFGNGYNNDPNGDGRAKLFVKYLDNSGMKLIDTGVGSMANNDCQDAGSDCNGLSTPELADLNGDGIIDRIYAGDLHGNMWVFDVDDTSPSNWVSAYKSGSTSVPLFEACTSTTVPCPAANRQPITAKPSLTRHPTRYKQATAPNIMVFFGTGQYLTASDNASSATQTFYGVWDGGSFDGHPRTSALKRSNLVEQTLTETSASIVDPNDKSKTITEVTRDVTDHTVNYDPSASPAEYGWRVDLTDSKERVVVNSVAIGDIIFFNTLIPNTTPCDAGGEGWLMNLDLINGGLPSFAVTDLFNNGFLNAPIIGGQKVKGVPTASSYIDIGGGNLYRVIGKSDGELEKGKVREGKPNYNVRTSWTHLQD